MPSWLIGAIVGVVVALVVGAMMPRRKCPNCGAIIKPGKSQGRENVWGTCSNCGCEIDKQGKRL